MIWARVNTQECPTCQGLGAVSGGRCPSCGRSFHESRFQLPTWLDKPLGAWVRSKEPHEIALALAMVPVLVPLPLLSFVIFAAIWRKTGTAKLKQWGPVIVIAAINILLSSWLLSEMAQTIVQTVLHWWSLPPQLLPSSPTQSPQAVPV